MDNLESLRSVVESISNYPNSIRRPEFQMPEIPDLRSGYRASDFYERLMEMIAEFEEELDDQHEVGARLVNFGQTLQFHLQDIGYYNPSMIRFYGETDNHEPIQLIQHISQISVMLVRMKKLDESKPASRIGFAPPKTDPEEQID